MIRIRYIQFDRKFFLNVVWFFWDDVDIEDFWLYSCQQNNLPIVHIYNRE